MLLEIKNKQVAQLLIEHLGFIFVAVDVDEIQYIEPPSGMSNTKARKIVSSAIKMNLAMQDMFKAKTRYNNLVKEINKIVMS